MLRSLVVVGVMSVFGVALVLGAGPTRSVDRKPSEPASKSETKTAQAKSGVVVESVMVGGSTVKTVKIRNTASKCVDVHGFSVSTSGGSRLELLRGSFDLAPGEVAMIITSSDIDSDDKPRAAYSNLYRAVGADGSVVSLTTDTFRLVDDNAFVLGGGNPDIFTVQGICCRDSNSCCYDHVSEEACCNLGTICGPEASFDATDDFCYYPGSCGPCPGCQVCP